MTKKLLCIAFAAVMTGAFVAVADDGGLMGKKGGNNSGNNSGQNTGSNSGGSNPPRTVPPPTRGNNTGGNVGGNQGRTNLPPVVSGGSRTTAQNSGSDNSIMNRARRQPAPNQSRSGEVQYGSVSNINRGGPQPQPQQVQRIDQYQIPQVFDRGGIAQDVNRQGNIQRNQPQQFRTGYYHYYNQWRDDYFFYPHYSFGYAHGHSVPSPFYRYNHLPAYINILRVVLGGTPWDVRGSSYRWNRPVLSVRGDRYSDLDYAIDDIVRSFEVGNIRFMDRVIPTTGRVTVELDRYSRYTLSGNDFYDLMRDAVEGTYTVNYRIREVRRDRNSISIRAEHQFRDSWGRTQTQIHLYGLQEARRGYEIRHFSAFFR